MITSPINRLLLIISGILIVSISGCSSPQQKVTVSISGRSTGSGFIVAKSNDTYYVLTSKHVVGIPPGQIDDKYKVKTFDGREYEINYEKLRPDSKFDLAIIEFTAKGKNYTVATISNLESLPKGITVYISGWKDCLKERKYEFNEGKVSKILLSKSDISKISDDPDYKEEDYNEGYIVNYTNPTIRGMSGSPVFDKKGRVVAIHGKPGHDKENPAILTKCPALDESFGNNWGIPIKNFLKSSIASNLQLKIDQSAGELQTSPTTSNGNKQPEPSGDIFKRPE
ncbi:S1 family peptidase [Aerosakkonema funiforme]|uniref:Trypsin-like peptidase domain-containing protein n=1 Tax=Aerosakkonema funiforme FACHB-1375 TaxID=2949571 RepID=A0A926VBI2_9CYAN|nr:serine protease [Aerosakkonema funiforme]MBD2180731.1 trypsin-like peptidase domain-containing protein [Aerosakkonema funiforme FACHB-1375]